MNTGSCWRCCCEIGGKGKVQRRRTEKIYKNRIKESDSFCSIFSMWHFCFPCCICRVPNFMWEKFVASFCFTYTSILSIYVCFIDFVFYIVPSIYLYPFIVKKRIRLEGKYTYIYRNNVASFQKETLC